MSIFGRPSLKHATFYRIVNLHSSDNVLKWWMVQSIRVLEGQSKPQSTEKSYIHKDAH